MQTLLGKHIILGVTGGIAAYKCAELVRRLRDEGAEVRVVMTQSATEFVTPLTFQALSGHPVHTDLLDTEAEAAMGHIELARWADGILIAPATANMIGKLAQGIANDLLSTLCLATEAPIAVAPAMNHIMWSDNATQDNIATLKNRHIYIFGPAFGTQACGETGEGRMLETHELIEKLDSLFSHESLSNTRVLITAGPTYEAIDPVRFIGNRSSGRMGFAIAQAAIEAGAKVTLIAGPVNLQTPHKVERIDVESAHQMYQAVMSQVAEHDIFIATAAVADYSPIETHDQKLKKSEEMLSIHLHRNPDILAEVAAMNKLFSVGFAAETEHLQDNARKKLKSKQLDMIAANQVANMENPDEDTGFNSEYNALDVYWPEGYIQLEKARKTELARKLIELIAEHYKTKH
ncbi:MAG: bifunctional phosphopantothenoylcysteine decarboxylase/phosphopantothenate--cysteine ligase CoaBC [Gammaproteobacteria bacterium]|nr:bifunctional phosphopantothenoylcysteine decarboxylase/phosphopantothenate--cysteine ligase CoaBC [Gammaproteobacteria bacterium]MCW8910360.1 bifunctional phosphopantothenoylcysteine decarboxylase/phosphopantothenate--cysteine ligase CoaBC [Gammaproteobacteria bacterium]MCW9005221.1 bifunctional phosphopantothenoylcysteine decarboxylase/phosphopantothenate--cysteine ligase CoaBC [Gammaproteobacteria bacterium]MCW9055322.1 bifunctional phosphopantothenoylcysteine decarboxylase/phosphopantothen